MARCTVALNKGLTNCGTGQATVRIMTATTRVMDLRITCIGQRWRIVMTVSTGRRGYLDQGIMIRRNRRMRVLPGVCMTRLTVAAGCKGLAYGRADQSTGAKRMTVGTVSNMRCRID